MTSAHGAAWDANGEAGANADSPGDEEAPQLRLEDYAVPEHCIPVLGNVLEMDEVWDKLAAVCEFDVIMMDPPWQLACANPTRGVAIAYQQLQDRFIADLPVPRLQPKGGLLCVWTINAKYAWTIQQMQQWGYDLVDEIVWVKMTVNRRIAKSHGYYLQHAKEVCLVGLKGEEPAALRRGVISDIIWSKRRGQSQKPDDIYQIIEDLVPGGRFLEIFGRKNNLRDHWVTIGNEVTGQNHLIDKIEEETAKQAPGVGEVVGAAAGRPSIEEGKGGAAAAAAAAEAAATAVAS
jgi:mRNA (2'-O-methyladenosine-N6-)-methyltransferase